MAFAYAGTWIVRSNGTPTSDQLAAARKLVGYLLQFTSAFNTTIMTRTLQLGDGSTVIATLNGTMPLVTILEPGSSAKASIELSTLWVPRGFVVYPAFHTALFGYGLPIIQDNSVGPYDPKNLSPGLTLSRWTVDGPCGEVLVSADLNAGYPIDIAIPTPLLADETKGPQFFWNNGNYDAREHKGSWTSYRLELAPFVKHYADENTSTQEELFETVNTARSNASVTAATLRFKGYGRPAEIAASVFDVAGTDTPTNPLYPTTYGTPADRVTKEGYTTDWSNASITSFTRTDLFHQYEFTASGISPSAAVTQWEGQQSGALTSDLGPAVTADVGYRNGYSVLAIGQMDRWIHAGNAYWQGSDPDLPIISWHSFASVNLAWETWPVEYDAATAPSVPFASVRPFTNSDGDCWLVYPRSTTKQVPAAWEPALSRHIYCRGRSIALAPNGGLVWAAGVAANGNKDRLIALIHHPSDQSSDVIHQGCTRYVRVWWADIPKRKGNSLRLDPQLTICGTDTTDDWSWRGGQLLDLASMPNPSGGFVASSTTMNSLKYASCWRFSSDGTKAVCLRDYSALPDYANVANDDWVVGSLTVRAVELFFTVDSTDTTASIVFHDYTSSLLSSSKALGSSSVPGCSDKVSTGNTLMQYSALPLAVDYNTNGQLVYAYQASIAPDITPVFASNTFRAYGFNYIYTGVGDSTIKYATDLNDLVLVGATMQTPSVSQAPGVVLVLDVNSATFACTLGVSAYKTDPSTWPNPSSGEALFYTNPDYLCQTFTTNNSIGVQLSHLGVVASTNWYPNPDGVLNTPFYPCINTGAPTGALSYLPLAASSTVQGFYANRFDETIYGYQIAPMPYAVPVLPSSPSGANSCGCQYQLSELYSAAWALYNQQAPRGGKAVSSVTLPENDWLIYAKVV